MFFFLSIWDVFWDDVCMLMVDIIKNMMFDNSNIVIGIKKNSSKFLLFEI